MLDDFRVLTQIRDDSALAVFGLVCVMFVGQALFVILWATLPWYRSWIGRSLMVKASSLALLLGFSIIATLVELRTGVNPWAPALKVAIYVLVAVGIWSQVVALVVEIRKPPAGRPADPIPIELDDDDKEPSRG